MKLIGQIWSVATGISVYILLWVLLIREARDYWLKDDGFFDNLHILLESSTYAQAFLLPQILFILVGILSFFIWSWR